MGNIKSRSKQPDSQLDFIWSKTRRNFGVQLIILRFNYSDTFIDEKEVMKIESFSFITVMSFIPFYLTLF